MESCFFTFEMYDKKENENGNLNRQFYFKVLYNFFFFFFFLQILGKATESIIKKCHRMAILLMFFGEKLLSKAGTILT